jgi:2-methylcitrate dehydratase PrpD
MTLFRRNDLPGRTGAYHGDKPDLERLVGGLGDSWEIAKNTIQTIPRGSHSMPSSTGCFKLRTRLNRRIDNIGFHSSAGFSAAARARHRPVRNERDARVSIHHCAACTRSVGAAGVPEFGEPIVFRPDIASLRRKVRAEFDASLTEARRA